MKNLILAFGLTLSGFAFALSEECQKADKAVGQAGAVLSDTWTISDNAQNVFFKAFDTYYKTLKTYGKTVKDYHKAMNAVANAHLSKSKNLCYSCLTEIRDKARANKQKAYIANSQAADNFHKTYKAFFNEAFPTYEKAQKALNKATANYKKLCSKQKY